MYYVDFRKEGKKTLRNKKQSFRIISVAMFFTTPPPSNNEKENSILKSIIHFRVNDMLSFNESQTKFHKEMTCSLHSFEASGI